MASWRSSQGETGQRSSAIAAFALLVSGLLLLIPVLRLPIGQDQAAFGYVAERWLEGDVPYRDVWDVKGPAVYFGYAVAFLLGGPTEATVRAVGIATTLATMLLLQALASRVYGRAAGTAGAGVYLLSSVSIGYFDPASLSVGFTTLGEGESLMQPSLVGGTWLLLAASRSRPWLGGAAAGLGWAFAVACKPNAILVPATLLLGEIAMVRGRLERRRVLYEGIGVVLGLSLPGAWVLGYFIKNQALGSLFETLWTFDVLVYGQLAQFDAATMLGSVWTWMKAHPLCGFYGIAACVFECRLFGVSRQSRLLGLWTLGSMGIVLSQGKYWPMHWMVLLPPLSLFAGHAIVTLARRLVRGPHHWAAALLFVGIAAAGVDLGQAYLAQALAWPKPHPAVLKNAAVAARDHEIASHVSARTGPGEPLLVYGYSLSLNFRAHRPAPSRFFNLFPVTASLQAGELGLRWQEEYLAAFRENRPLYVVVATNRFALPSEALESRMQAMLKEGYGRECVIEGYELHRDLLRPADR